MGNTAPKHFTGETCIRLSFTVGVVMELHVKTCRCEAEVHMVCPG